MNGFVQQLFALLIAQGQQTLAGLGAEASSANLLADGQRRLRTLAKAVNDQIREIADVVGPALGGPLPPTENAGLPRGVVEHGGRNHGCVPLQLRHGFDHQ